MRRNLSQLNAANPDTLMALIQGEPEPGRDWRERAACLGSDPEAFFPDETGSVLGAKRICEGCPVKAACAAFAWEIEAKTGIENGVWGGLSAQERRKIRRSGRTLSDAA